MKIGILTNQFNALHLNAALDAIQAAGIEAIELGAGGYAGTKHLDDAGGVARLVESDSARRELLNAVESRGLMISALSAHGNPLHPDRAIADAHHSAFLEAVNLASLLGVPVVNGFSGCPAGARGDATPNWVTCAWPDEYRDILDYQWNEVAVPYWREQNALLADHGVKFAIEAHPGFLVYNPETLLRLRAECGEQIGANLDPSHFFWQGIEPVVAARALGEAGAIFHVHAKDTRIDPQNAALNGTLDTKSYGDVLNRAWVFRSCGYGHDVRWWKDFVSMLRTVGYDYVLSIEHEDGLMSGQEGLAKALECLKQAVVREPPGDMFWARD